MGDMAKPPNVLLFMCDDLRWDALSGMGDPVVRTPNLDRLMKRGTTFTRCTIPGSTSGAVCMPSRAMVHTGRGLFELESNGATLPEAHTTLGEHLQRQGYKTFHTGKWHNDAAAFNRSFSNGSNIFFGGMGDQWNMPVFDYDPSGAYASTVPFVANWKFDKEVETLPGDRRTNGLHATDVFCDTACAFIQEQVEELPPFFLSVALTAPHDPRNAPERFHALYPPEEMPLPKNFLAQHPHQTGSIPGRDEALAPTPRTPELVREHLSDYYAMITHLDEGFGRIIAALEQSGELENTIVVFTADHGIAMGQHGLLGKQNLYEHSLRIPMILAGPGIPEGKHCDARILHYGLMPTLLNLLGLEVPESVTGAPFSEFFEKDGPGLEELYLAYFDSMRGLISEDWKLIEYRGDGVYCATQLFHLQEDPLERFDRSFDPGQQDRIAFLRSRMMELKGWVGDSPSEWGLRFWRRWSG